MGSDCFSFWSLRTFYISCLKVVNHRKLDFNVVLSKTNFQCNDENYLQVLGTERSTKSLRVMHLFLWVSLRWNFLIPVMNHL